MQLASLDLRITLNRQRPLRHASVCRSLCWLVVLIGSPNVSTSDDTTRFFESEIRPLLVTECGRCHGSEKQSHGLRVDSRQSLIDGGETGAGIVPGDPAASLIMQAVRRQGELEMPPDKSLSDRQIQALERWIEWGAPWPQESEPDSASVVDRAKEHWAFRPVLEPKIPEVKESAWLRTPIDAFVLARLETNKLHHSAAADRRTLIRRVFYTLIGLPPSAKEVDEFANDLDRNAYERLVERLLQSTHYGEQWARHWLDVARYSDTKGYVYAREERFWVHAWSYRDWVVNALNTDLPYNKSLLLQLAADQIDDRNDSDIAAMGFLTIGRRFLGVARDIIDDRIDVVSRGTMALTVGCARCHDHKYDPIATADYYSLYGVFDSCAERVVRVDSAMTSNEEFEQELTTRQKKLQTELTASRFESSDRARDRVGDYLRAQTTLHKFPPEGFDQIFQPADLLPSFVWQWEDYLRRAEREGNPIFVPWHAYGRLPQESFAIRSVAVTEQLQNSTPETVNPIIAAAFVDPPQTFDDVIDRYAAIFADVNSQWSSALAAAKAQEISPPIALPDPPTEAVRRILYGSGAPCVVPDLAVVDTEHFFDTGRCEELWKLQAAVDRWILDQGNQVTFALTLIDRPTARQPRIFRRGNPMDKGAEVARQLLPLLSNGSTQPFRRGSGRLELAQAIVNPANPLTARVIVNRVWTHHFGRGLVSTPSDFGMRAAPPSHPQLLDWLATRFVAEGWSLKQLHRWIVLSATFRQVSTGPADPTHRSAAVLTDPENRLLWRMNHRRLTFEEFRDSMLAVTGDLDRRVGGKPDDLFKTPFTRRRTLYGLVDRQFLPSTLRTFDFANPDLHIPQRSETTVPQQALFFLNHPMVLERSRALARICQTASTPEAAVQQLFQLALQRPPRNEESAESLALIRSFEQEEPAMAKPTAGDWQYGFGSYDPESEGTKEFQNLPHFADDAWQGGPDWPDPKLGWVQLTASGGHPGDDHQHNSIRRWTAPRAMTVQIDSRLVHEPAEGDGIQGWIVSSRSGLLNSKKNHHETFSLNVDPLTVEAGETIDFIVDIVDTVDHDQYLWEATITESDAGPKNMTWNSKADFPPRTILRLNAWEQLAQLVLCTNEFLFVD